MALAREGLKRLDGFGMPRWTTTQKISASVMRWSLDNVIANEPFEDYNFVFSQFSGAQSRPGQLHDQYPPDAQHADVDSYLARLDQVGMRMDEALARARAAAAKKLIPPRFILERAQFQVDHFLKPSAPRTCWSTSLTSAAPR